MAAARGSSLLRTNIWMGFSPGRLFALTLDQK
jgi:hypothetical protein